MLITLRHTTLGRTPVDELSARRRDLYPTTYSTRKRQTTMPQTGFVPAFPAGEWSADPCIRPRGHWDRRWCV